MENKIWYEGNEINDIIENNLGDNKKSMKFRKTYFISFKKLNKIIGKVRIKENSGVRQECYNLALEDLQKVLGVLKDD
jgi:hypothetical protein